MSILTARRAHRGLPYPRVTVSLAVVALGIAAPARAGAEPPTEHQVKAAFLYNFAKFVEWPAEALPDSTTPIVIGVLGPDPFGADLDRTLAGKLVDRHPVQVRRFEEPADVARCHVLFVGIREAPALRPALARLADVPALTVGETDDFLRLGGIVRFVVADNKVRFEINKTAATRARLRLSSKLLRLALVVYEVER